MFQLLGIFSGAIGMFYTESDVIPSSTESEILTETGSFIITQTSEYIITE